MRSRQPLALDEGALREVFARYPEIWAVYLFGSVAEGRSGPLSDLDLGVVICPGSNPPDQLDLLADLVRAGFERVDVVFLDPVEIRDIVLWFEVVRHNRVIYATDAFDRGELFSRIVRLYWDFLPLLEVQRRAYKERLLHGPSRSDPQAPSSA